MLTSAHCPAQKSPRQPGPGHDLASAAREEFAMTMAPAPFETQDVLNQPPPLVDYDLFGTDRALQEAVAREGAGWALDELGSFGRTLGRAETSSTATAAGSTRSSSIRPGTR
jgi:hypothetical protein